MNEHEIILAAKTGTAVTYAASTVTVFAGLTANEWGVLIGIFCALIGLLMQWYFGYEKLKLQRQLYSKIKHPNQEPGTGKGEL